MSIKKSIKINAEIAEFLKTGGKITTVAPKKVRRTGFTARANSPKRRNENRWDLQYDKPVAQG